MDSKVVGIIPARYQSSRFPGKPLAEILGVPLIIRVCRRVATVFGSEGTYVATDDERIQRVVKDAGFQCVMTSSSALTGTDRVCEAALQIEADIYVNVQGDEPLIDPEDIHRVIAAKRENPEFVVNAMSCILQDEDPTNSKLPKPVVDCNNRLLYISRAMVPASKTCTERLDNVKYFKQVCIYAFDRAQLDLFCSGSEKAKLEAVEDIEILRFLELGQPVKMVETANVSVAVDYPEDIAIVEQHLHELEKEVLPLNGLDGESVSQPYRRSA